MRISDWSSDVCSSDLLRVSNARARLELGDMFIEAAENIGIPRTSDFNRGDQTGVGYIQQTTYNGLRCITAVSYLRTSRNRAYLAILTNAHVARVIFECQHSFGVTYSPHTCPRLAVPVPLLFPI